MRARILVVEDDPGVRELVGAHLQRREYDVRLAESAESLLPDLRSDSLAYSAALVDIHLPGTTTRRWPGRPSGKGWPRTS